MQDFSGFTEVEKCFDTEVSSLFTALKDGVPVTIKLLNRLKPSPAELLHYQYEYESIKDIDEEYFVKVLDFQLLDDSCYIVMQGRGLQSIEVLLQEGKLDFDEKTHIALKMAELLEKLQSHHIIHKAISLSNLLYNEKDRSIKLGNFSSSIRLISEKTVFNNPNANSAELCYFSPEQTGRMNRDVDYRSDFYSVGICLYKLFCGCFPFEKEDKLELYHAIIASSAKPPIEVDSSVPQSLNNIIMKLLEKNSEHRYQSSHGLLYDLHQAVALCEQNKDEGFELGTEDKTGRLYIPQKLFGRKKEENILIDAFGRISKGGKEILLIAGYSGVGKSALVNEVHKPITKEHGFFIEGKFDQFQRDKPYLTMVQAFSSWVHLIMSESAEDRTIWKEKILDGLGRNAQVVINLIPAFEKLLGEQAPIEELSGIEAQNRFNFLFTSLIRSIASKEHPLVLFVDDLQWSDQATLNLIETLFADVQSSHFLLFGAYRDNEVDEAHPLLKSITHMQQDEVLVNTLSISNLKRDDVSELLSQTLSQSTDELSELVDLVYDKTAGNAFFVNSFISSLADEGLLSFSFDQQKWTWDIKDLYEKNLTQNVVDLMSKQISRFPKESQNVLTLAACIGNRFDINTLSIINEKTVIQTAKDLNYALQRGFVVPLREAYKYIDFSKNEQNILYKFAHDRIQQAAYSFLSEENKPNLHLNISMLLQKNTQNWQMDNHLFEIVNHANIAEHLIEDESRRKEMAELNYRAALKAQKAVAFQASYDFLSFCLQYMPSDHWESMYKLSYDACLMQSEIAYMIQNFNVSKALTEEILIHAKTGVEKSKAQNLSVLRETMQGHYLEAIEHGREGMKLIGFALPDDEYDQNFGKDLQEINRYLQTHEISSLAELPVCEDEAVVVATAILMNMGPPTYMAFKPLYPVVCSRFVLMAIDNGNTLFSSIAYSNYGIVLAAMMGQYEAGYEFGLVSLNVGKAFNNMPQICKNSFMFASILNNWVHPIKQGTPVNEEGYHIGVESGEVQFVGYILYSKLLLSFVQGESLESIKESLPYSYRYQEKTQNKWAIDNIGALSCAIYKLVDEESPLISESAYIESVSDEEGQSGLCFYKIFMAQVEFVMKNYDKCLSLTQEAVEIIPNIYGFLPVLDNNFYNSLALSMIGMKKEKDDRSEVIASIEENQEQLKLWSDKVEENFLHKYLFVQAQLAWLKGNNEEARGLYIKSLESARVNNFFQDLALISENYGLFLYENDTHKVAKVYFDDALYYYKRWSAKVKVKELQAFLLDKFNVRESNSGKNLESLDYNSIIKSIHLISSEVDFSQLIHNYITISMENAGAQKAVLLMLKDNQLKVVLQKRAGIDAELSDKTINDFDQDELLIHPLVQKVYQTSQAIILDDASKDDVYAKTPYVLKDKPLSALAIPIKRNESLEAILYLENALVTHLFTPERVELLSILGAQMGISFENARLYTNLEDKVQERTKELKSSNQDLVNTMQNLKETQNQLVEAQKHASLGKLVAGVAHQINTPLGVSITGITTFSNEVKEIRESFKADKVSKSALEKFLGTSQNLADIIYRNLQHAASLIQNFKKISVDQRGKKLSKIVLKEAINESMIQFSQEIKSGNIQVHIECEEELSIEAYEDSIYQVFTTLFSNSMVHAFDKNIKNKNIVIRIKKEDKIVLLSYCDNGKGISNEYITKIFDPFFTTQIGQGSIGLGLPVVHNIVSQHLKGSISVTSTQDPKETCFTIRIPKPSSN